MSPTVAEVDEVELTVETDETTIDGGDDHLSPLQCPTGYSTYCSPVSS